MSTEPLKLEAGSDYHSIRGEGFILHANWNAIRTLGKLVGEGVQALPRRGLEVGGLLLGSSDGPSIQLADIHAVMIEHQFGPSYQLSDVDVEVFRETIKRLQEAAGPRVIGHFRSHTKGELEVMFADLTIAALTGAAQPVMLLVTASASEPPLARLYRKSGDKCVAMLAFPLPSGTSALPEISLEPVPVDAPAAEPSGNEVAAVSHELPEAKPRTRTIGGRWWPAALAACLLLAAAWGGYSLWRQRHHVIAPEKQLIQLAVQQLPGSIRVTWNRESALVRSSSSGVLTVQDGTYSRTIPLTQSQLTSGSVFYEPRTETVQFRLDLYRSQEVVTGEAVVALGGQAAADNKPPVPTISIDVPPARTGTASRLSDSGFAHVPAALRRQFQPLPESPPAAGRAAPLPDAQISLTPRLDPTATAGVPILPPPAPPTPAQPVPNLSIPVPPAVTYIAAVPVKKVVPAVTPRVRSLIHESVSIEVSVRIDFEGRVIDASPVNATSSTQKLLSADAVQAAMLWRFEPARKNGHPVASETVLKFDFGRRSR